MTTKITQYDKQGLRRLVANGSLSEALEATIAYATDCGLEEHMNGLLALQSRLAKQESHYGSGIVSYTVYTQVHAQVTNQLLKWISRLPDLRKPTKRGASPLQLATFKKRIFYFIVVSKGITALWLVYQYETGGYSLNELKSIVGILTLGFGGYITIMLSDYMARLRQNESEPIFINGPLVTFAYWLFPIYTLSILLLIQAKAAQSINFGDMSLALALIEGVLGGYIHKIVQNLFRNADY